MRRFGRIPYREKLARNKAALDFLADMSGKPRLDITLPPEPKRRAPAGASGKPLERDIRRAIEDTLRLHPKVAFVWKMQSGLFQDGDRMIRVGTVGVPDLVAMMRGSGQLVGLEIKRPGKYATPQQQAWLDAIKQHGGKAGVARSVEDALKIIES